MAGMYLTTAAGQRDSTGGRGVWWALLAIVVAALVAGCGGSGGTGEVERPAAATAERVRVENGAATLQSVVRVEFPGPIELALEGEELLEAIRLQTPGAGAGPRATRVPVTDVSVEGDGEEGNVLVIETDGLVPNDTEVRIDRAALADGASGSVATDVAADLSQLQVLLASVPVEPTRQELFSGGQQAPVEAADVDPEAQRQALEAHLRARGSNDEVVARALETFDNMPGDIVQDPKLAAAIAGLTGSFAEPAITDLLTENNCTGLPAARIAFEEPPDFPDLLARVTYTESGARVVSINPALEGEPVQLLAAILLHEAIHCDQVSGQDEEIAATGFDTYFYLLLLATEPELAQAGTLLTQNYNVDALALINSGRTLPESIGILPGPGQFDVLPGTESGFQSFAAYVAASYGQSGEGPTPPEPLAEAYAQRLAAMFDDEARNPFDLAYLDALLGLSLTTDALLAAMDALWLEPAS